MKRAAGLAIALYLAFLAAANAAPAPRGAAIAWVNLAIKQAQQRHGEDGAALLPLYQRLARLHFAAGDLAAATSARRRALRIALQAFGRDSPETAEAMIRLAESDLGRLHYFAAEGMLIIAGNIVEARLGAHSQAREPVFIGLARIALARGDLVPAEALARRAVALRAENPHPSSSAALRVLGAVMAAQHEFDKGETVLNEAVAFDRARHDRPGTARSLAQLGNLYLRADRFGEALPVLEQAAALDQERFAPTHPFIADDLHDIAIAEQGLKHLGLARQLLANALAILRSEPDQNRTRIALSELDLAHVDRLLGDNAAADAAFARGRRLLNKARKEEHRRERQA